jgi:EAL domain-containing protein (putative c-di-GMP-specific phosphodiesterase class I)
VLLNASTEVRRWHALGFERLGLCVNFSPAQLQPHKVGYRIESILERSGLAPGQLNIELNSVGLARSEAPIGRALHELKESGVRLSLDNFGAGVFPIAELKQLPLDTLKIDRSLIGNISHSQNGEDLVRAVALVGKSFGLDVEAEGVETVRQLDLVGREGCERAQGYLLSRPLEPDAIVTLLNDAHAFDRIA